MLLVFSKFMKKVENYTLNILTSSYYLFRFLFLRIIELFSKKLMEISYGAINKLFRFAEQRFNSEFLYLTTLFCRLFSTILRGVQLFLEIPSLIVSLIYEIIFYCVKTLFRIYDGVVLTILWFLNLPLRFFNFSKKTVFWVIALPSLIVLKLKNLIQVLHRFFYFSVTFLKSFYSFMIYLFITIKNLKLEDVKKLKNIDKNYIRELFIWFFKVKLGFNREARSQFHSFLENQEYFIKLTLTFIFYRITQIDMLTNGFLED